MAAAEIQRVLRQRRLAAAERNARQEAANKELAAEITADFVSHSLKRTFPQEAADAAAADLKTRKNAEKEALAELASALLARNTASGNVEALKNVG